MNPLTRSLYRELAPKLAKPADRHAHEFLLSACNKAMRRLLTGETLPARPVRSLFRDIRHLFSLGDQETILKAVRAHVRAALLIAASFEDMRRRDCQVFSRKGALCHREALPGSGFCPSHKHLVEEEHDLEPTAAGLSFESFETSSWSGRSRGTPLGDIALWTKE